MHCNPESYGVETHAVSVYEAISRERGRNPALLIIEISLTFSIQGLRHKH
ncbi:MAG: hypothetical protein ACYCSW_01725 [bacterium]